MVERTERDTAKEREKKENLGLNEAPGDRIFDNIKEKIKPDKVGESANEFKGTS